MAVSARFEADFSQFVASTKNAEASLKSLEAGGSELGKSFEQLKGTAASLAGAFGIAFSVGSVVSFGKSVFDAAGQIHDMAQQLGISTDAVQGFKAAAEGAGSTLDAVGSALTKMNVNLAGGGDSTIEALRMAGLRFEAIRAMKPEDAFLAITDAIAKIPDPMTQADVALKLFGESAAKLLPAIKEGFRGAAEEAAKMSENTIDSLERAGDAWQSLANQVTIATGGIISQMISAASQVKSGWQGVATFAENVIKFGFAQAMVMADSMAAVTASVEKAAAAAAKLPPPVQQAAFDIGKMREEMLKTEAARVVGSTVVPTVKNLGDTVTVTARAIRGLTDEERAAAQAAFEHNRELERQNDLLAKIAAHNKAISASGKLYMVDAQGNKQLVGGSFENDLKGRITPISGTDANNPAALQRMIAALTKTANEWTPPSADTFRGEESAFAGMPRYYAYQRLQLEAAQKHADDLRQLEYLQQLLSVIPSGPSGGGGSGPVFGGGFGGGGSISFTFNISGMLDQRTIRQIRSEFEESVMTTLRIGRQLGTA